MGILELHDLRIMGILHRRARADGHPHREAGVRVVREEVLAPGVLVRIALERLRPVAGSHVDGERREVQEEGLLAALGQLDLLDRLPGEEVRLVVARVDDLLRLGLVDELAVEVVPRPLRRVVVVAANVVTLQVSAAGSATDRECITVSLGAAGGAEVWDVRAGERAPVAPAGGHVALHGVHVLAEERGVVAGLAQPAADGVVGHLGEGRDGVERAVRDVADVVGVAAHQEGRARRAAHRVCGRGLVSLAHGEKQ